MSVLILMSTYNGERFLKTQLDSIMAQDYEDIELLVRDDGSSDSTCEILDLYAAKNSWIHWYCGENIGVQKSFFDLIHKANLNKDYYAFADQDDKWLPGKISRAVFILDQINCKEPVLYCSDKVIVNENLEPIHVSVKRTIKKTTFGNALVQDICTGCTSVLNNNLFCTIRDHAIPDHAIMHDWWFYLTAACFGTVYYDKKAYILYRQHGNNVSGAMLSKTSLLKYRLTQLIKPRGNIYKQAREFLEIFTQKPDRPVPAEMRKIAEKLLRSQESFKGKLSLIFNRRIYRQKISDDFIMRLAILIGKL